MNPTTEPDSEAARRIVSRMPGAAAYDGAYYEFSRPDSGVKNRVDVIRDGLIRRQILRRVRGGALLDVGCGVGMFLQTMSDRFELYGADISDYAIEQCQRRLPDAHLAVGSLAGGVPFERTFDVISAINIFEHLDEPVAAAAALRARLRPSGLLVAHLPTIGNAIQERLYRGSYDADPTHIYRPSGRAFTALVEAAGFRRVSSAYAPFVGGIWKWVPVHPAYLAVFEAT